MIQLKDHTKLKYVVKNRAEICSLFLFFRVMKSKKSRLVSVSPVSVTHFSPYAIKLGRLEKVGPDGWHSLHFFSTRSITSPHQKLTISHYNYPFERLKTQYNILVIVHKSFLMTFKYRVVWSFSVLGKITLFVFNSSIIMFEFDWMT